MAHEFVRKVNFDCEAEDLLDSITQHFATINLAIELTDDDKKRLKECYLINLVTPRCKALLERHFPEIFGGSEPTLDELCRKFA